MVADRSPHLDNVFHALAHPVRREMLHRLAQREWNLSELASPFKISFQAASKHVRVLERASLVKRRAVGREHVCRIHAAPLRDVAEWTETYRQFWESRFERLDAVLEEMKAIETQARGKGTPPHHPPNRPSEG